MSFHSTKSETCIISLRPYHFIFAPLCDNPSRIFYILSILILHEDKVECTIKDCVYEVSHTKVEDEQIGDGLHFSVF